MKQQRNQQSEAVINLRLWTLGEAAKSVPYLRALVQSLRDNWLDLRQAQETVRRAEARPGRPDRDSIIRLAESQSDVLRCEAKLQETINEMLALSAYSLDPVAGLATIPFRRADALAWFIFDLFDPQGFVGWQLHSDPPETRRPLKDLDNLHGLGEIPPGVEQTN